MLFWILHCAKILVPSRKTRCYWIPLYWTSFVHQLFSCTCLRGSGWRTGAVPLLARECPAETGAVIQQSSALLNKFYAVLCFSLADPGQEGAGQEGAGAECGWAEQGPRCRRCPRPASLWLAQGAVSVYPRSASPAVSSRRPVLPEPFGNVVSQPASPGLLWQRLTLENQLWSCL